jgi:flagellar hook-length control protein FliK
MLTLPNIQKMDMGGEDSARLIKRTKSQSKLNVKFDDLLKEDEQSPSPSKKRAKQGELSKSWMNAQIIQNVESGLRRKDAEQFPGKENNFKTFLTEKVALKGKTRFSQNENNNILSKYILEDLLSSSLEEEKSNALKESRLLKNNKGKKDSAILSEKYFSSPKEANEIHFSDSKISRQTFIDTQDSKVKREKEFSNFSKSIEPNSLNQSDIVEESSTIRSINSDKLKAFSKNEKSENFSDDPSSIRSNTKSDLTNLNFNLDFISDDSRINFNNFSSDQSKFTEPILRHLAQNISQNYSISLDKLINSFDNISFKPIESGFALKMRLYPEELGELELHLKKEGMNISLIAFVMNEEAKQVMMNDAQNLSNFFMNQGYNLEQIMVEVKNDNQNQNFENFDKIIAENKNSFNLVDNDENISGKKSISSIKKFGYFKGIGRLINKYV